MVAWQPAQAGFLRCSSSRSRTLTGANAAMAIVGAVAFSEFFLLTLYLQDVLHYSAIESGLAFSGFALSVVVTSNIAQLIVGRLGVRPTLTAGLLAGGAHADAQAATGRGLSTTRGNYRSLLRLFGMPASDYKRFLNFLAAHDCNVDFRAYRNGTAPTGPTRAPRLLPPLGERAGGQGGDASRDGEGSNKAF